jgi:hypothetical protein
MKIKINPLDEIKDEEYFKTIKPLAATLYEKRREAVNKYIDEEMNKLIEFATPVAKPKQQGE